MGQSAKVLSEQPIEDLKAALGRFGGEGQEMLNQAGQEVRRTFEWLSERERHWAGMVRRCQEEVQRAQAALRACYASTSEGYTPNCVGYERELLQAKVRLAQAEDALQTVKEWARLVQKAAEDYRLQAQRLGGMLSGDLQRGGARLGLHLRNLEAYTAEQPPPGIPPTTVGAPEMFSPISGPAESVGGVEIESSPQAVEGSFSSPERG